MSIISEKDEIRRIKNAIEDWRSLTRSQLNRSINQRRFFYDTTYAKSQMGQLSVAGGSYAATYNLVRTALNRAKTDLRDLNIYYELTPSSLKYNPQDRAYSQAILNQLQQESLPNLYSNADDIFDLSFTAAMLDMEMDDNGLPKPTIRRVNDLHRVYADSSVCIHDVNTKGNYVGMCEMVDFGSNKDLLDLYDIKDKDIKISGGKFEVINHFERYLHKRENFGTRYDGVKGRNIQEKVKKGRKYQRKYKKNMFKIRHKTIISERIVEDRLYELSVFPIAIGFGQALDSMCETITDRISLVPFADSCEDIQKITNMSASLYFKFMSQSRGSSKLSFVAEAVQGDGDSADFSKIYENRNTSDQDLPFHPLDLGDGQKQVVAPVPVPDIPLSPVVTEALRIFPTAINQILGTSLEQDVTTNLSGDAIKAMQIIREKGSKLYKDCFLDFMRPVGAILHAVFTEYYTAEMVVAGNIGGTTVPIPINMIMEGGAIQNDMSKIKEKFKFDVRVGSSPATNREKTLASLDKMYSILPPDKADVIIKNTAELYASSLDTPDRDIISEVVKSSLEETEKSKKDAEEQQKQQMQQQQAMQQQEMKIKEKELALKVQEAQINVEVAQEKQAEAVLKEHRAQSELAISKEELEVKREKHSSDLLAEREASYRTELKTQAETEKAQADIEETQAKTIKYQSEIIKNLKGE